jgi:hypothetical protein
VTTHKWQARLAVGEEHERHLDAMVMRMGCVELRAATMAEQKRGIDRHVKRPTGEWVSVQYKTDDQVQRWQNCFVEIAHIGNYNALGWACTLEAQWLLYWDLAADGAYLLSRQQIKDGLLDWVRQYPIGKAHNDNYVTLGIRVPLAIVQHIALRTIHDVKKLAA